MRYIAYSPIPCQLRYRKCTCSCSQNPTTAANGKTLVHCSNIVSQLLLHTTLLIHGTPCQVPFLHSCHRYRCLRCKPTTTLLTKKKPCCSAAAQLLTHAPTPALHVLIHTCCPSLSPCRVQAGQCQGQGLAHPCHHQDAAAGSPQAAILPTPQDLQAHHSTSTAQHSTVQAVS